MEFKPYSQDNMAACLELFDLNCPSFLHEKSDQTIRISYSSCQIQGPRTMSICLVGASNG